MLVNAGLVDVGLSNDFLICPCANISKQLSRVAASPLRYTFLVGAAAVVVGLGCCSCVSTHPLRELHAAEKGLRSRAMVVVVGSASMLAQWHLETAQLGTAHAACTLSAGKGVVGTDVFVCVSLKRT